MSAVNLGAHSLAGFQKSFVVDKPCRFCLANREDIQTFEVRQGVFHLRTVQDHNRTVNEVKRTEPPQAIDGVKGDCILKRLEYFETIKDFPPDLLHDLFEGIIPLELILCFQTFTAKKYFDLDELNSAIRSFPYKFGDKTNKPQQILQCSQLKGSLGGNGHENWTLLRLLPLIIGKRIPETQGLGDTSAFKGHS